ncbi:MAG: glycosyltransferase [Gemmatimonadota bacterium]
MADWPSGTGSAAELMALQLMLRLQRGPGRFVPIVMPAQGGLNGLSMSTVEAVRDAIKSSAPMHQALLSSDGSHAPAVLLRLLGPALQGLPDIFARPAVVRAGIVCGTDTAFDAGARARGAQHDVLIARSAWTRDVLASHGLDAVRQYGTGVDCTTFAPGQKSADLADRFVIFSAGRLCYRKGQDLVLAAAKLFRARHPETLLLTCWQSPFPEQAVDIVRSGLVSSAPDYSGGQLRIVDWAMREGLPTDAIVELGTLSQLALATLMNAADVALFPNRAESDANPHVLECMAKGIPTILSRNTGHRDVALPDYSWPLEQQGPLRGGATAGGTDGWGESSVDEIVEQLEWVYANREAAREKAARARAAVMPFDWATHAQRLAVLLAPIASRSRAA